MATEFYYNGQEKGSDRRVTPLKWDTALSRATGEMGVEILTINLLGALMGGGATEPHLQIFTTF